MFFLKGEGFLSCNLGFKFMGVNVVGMETGFFFKKVNYYGSWKCNVTVLLCCELVNFDRNLVYKWEVI